MKTIKSEKSPIQTLPGDQTRQELPSTGVHREPGRGYGSTESARKASAASKRLRAAHATVGDRICSAWLVARGVCWVQTREPRLAGILAQRSDANLVAYGVRGGYLKTFEVTKSLAWAERWMARHANSTVE